MELNLLDFLLCLREAEAPLTAHRGILTTEDGHTLDIEEAIKVATPTVSNNKVDAPQARNPAPLRYWAVTGRIPGDDEDQLHIFRLATRDDAIAAFEHAIWERELDSEAARENVFKSHGQTIFINSIVASNAPIEEL